jgi:hypothetical protein
MEGTHTLASEGVDVGGVDVLRPVAREAIGTQGVEGDQDDVEVFGCHRIGDATDRRLLWLGLGGLCLGDLLRGSARAQNEETHHDERDHETRDEP